MFIRTVDIGSINGRVGLYFIRDVYKANGILVSKVRYRTHPIHVFFSQSLNYEQVKILQEYFNILLEYFRQQTDSEFMTTYKYSDSSYTIKYLGISQAKELLETYPINELNKNEKEKLTEIINKKEELKLITFIQELTHRKEFLL